MVDKEQINSLNYFFEKEISKYTHYEFLIIDLSVISDGRNELLKNIEKFRELIDGIRIIIVALKYEGPLLKELIKRNIYNIITGGSDYMIEQQIIKAFSSSGMTYSDVTRFFGDDEESSKKKNKSLFNILREKLPVNQSNKENETEINKGKTNKKTENPKKEDRAFFIGKKINSEALEEEDLKKKEIITENSSSDKKEPESLIIENSSPDEKEPESLIIENSSPNEKKYFKKIKANPFSHVSKLFYKKPEIIVQETPTIQTQTKIIKEVIKPKIINGKTMIYIYGSQSRIGATTQAIQITKFFNKNNIKACYIQANGSNHIENLLQTYQNEVDLDYKTESVKLDGVYIYNEMELSLQRQRDFFIYVIDCGCIEHFEKDFFLFADYKILVCGAKGWEEPHTKNSLRMINADEDIKLLFSFISEAQEESLKEALYPIEIYVPGYSPNPLELSKKNEEIYKKLFRKFF